MQATDVLTRAPAERLRTRITLSVLSVWTWLEMAIVIILGLVVQSVVAAVVLPFDRRRAVTGRLFRLVGVLAGTLTPLWRFGVVGPLPARAPRRTVVVGNHCSNSDPFLISHLPWEMKWLAKASMFEVPVIGWMLRLAGDVPVVRGDKASAERALAACAAWLAREMPVMIFPEGTRSKSGALGEFKDGAFRLAIESGADVLPIAVAGTSHALPKHSWRLGYARAAVTVGEPISTRGMTLDDVPALKQRAREEIVRLQRRVTQAIG